MSLRDNLKKQLIKDYTNAPKTYINQNGVELKWDAKDKLYIGIDSQGGEWMASLQTTTIPMYSVNCTNKVKNYGLEKLCGEKNIFPLCLNTIKCRKCKKPFIPDINIDPTSAAYETWKNLDI